MQYSSAAHCDGQVSLSPGSVELQLLIQLIDVTSSAINQSTGDLRSFFRTPAQSVAKRLSLVSASNNQLVPVTPSMLRPLWGVLTWPMPVPPSSFIPHPATTTTRTTSSSTQWDRSSPVQSRTVRLSPVQTRLTPRFDAPRREGGWCVSSGTFVIAGRAEFESKKARVCTGE